MSDISLTSSMRNNLLSLQQTTRLQQLTQNRLASGLKVNSAIDNPSSYYTAQSLNNRAEDLNVLLDAMSQGIQTLKAVNEAIESGTKFLEQAKSVASAAMENTQPIAARVKTEAELLAAINSGKQGLIVLERDLTMSTNQNIVLQDGQSLVGARYLDKSAAQAKISFNFGGEAKNGIELRDNSLISDLDLEVITDTKGELGKASVINVGIADGVRINNINIKMDTSTDTSTNFYAGIAAYDNIGDVKISGKVSIKDIGNPATTNNTIGIIGGLSQSNHASFILNDTAILNIETEGSFGYGVFYGKIITNDNAAFNLKINGTGGRVISRASLIMNGNSTSSIKASSAGGLGFWESNLIMNDKANFNIDSAGAVFRYSNISMNSAQATINITSTSAFSFAQISRAVVGSSINCSIGRFEVNTPINTATGYIHNNTFPAEFTQTSTTPSTIPDIDIEMTKTPPKTKEKEEEKSKQFNQILAQYDRLVNDASYKGVNLLKSQDLKVVFNESRSSDLEIKGINGTASGLGLTTASWSNTQNVQDSLDELDSAINQLRLHSSEFGNYYQVVTTREDFTNSLINVLTEGADSLTLADMNQESANMLALQTRQQLAINSLSLASQASQSVLKLF